MAKKSGGSGVGGYSSKDSSTSRGGSYGGFSNDDDRFGSGKGGGNQDVAATREAAQPTTPRGKPSGGGNTGDKRGKNIAQALTRGTGGEPTPDMTASMNSIAGTMSSLFGGPARDFVAQATGGDSVNRSQLAPYQGPMPDGSVIQTPTLGRGGIAALGDRELALVAGGVGLPGRDGGFVSPSIEASKEAGFELVGRGYQNYDEIASLFGGNAEEGFTPTGSMAADRMAAFVDAYDQDLGVGEDIAEFAATSLPFGGVFYEYGPGAAGFQQAMEAPWGLGRNAGYGVDPMSAIASGVGLAAGLPMGATAAASALNRMAGRPMGIEMDRAAVIGSPDPTGMPNPDNFFNMQRNSRDAMEDYFFGESAVDVAREAASDRAGMDRDEGYSDSDEYWRRARGITDEEVNDITDTDDDGIIDGTSTDEGATGDPTGAMSGDPSSAWRLWAGADYPQKTGDPRNDNAWAYHDKFFNVPRGGALEYTGFHGANPGAERLGIASIYGMHPEHYFFPNSGRSLPGDDAITALHERYAAK